MRIRWIWIFLFLAGCGTTLQELQEDCLERDLNCDKAIAAEDRQLKKRQNEELREMLVQYCKEQEAIMYCDDRSAGRIDYSMDCYCLKTRDF